MLISLFFEGLGSDDLFLELLTLFIPARTREHHHHVLLILFGSHTGRLKLLHGTLSEQGERQGRDDRDDDG